MHRLRPGASCQPGPTHGIDQLLSMLCCSFIIAVMLLACPAGTQHHIAQLDHDFLGTTKQYKAINPIM